MNRPPTSRISAPHVLSAPPSRAKTRWRTATAAKAAREACLRVAPLWPLKNFVAANPCLGLTAETFLSAAERLGRVAPGGLRMDPAFYREKIRCGEITGRDLEAAWQRATRLPGIDPRVWEDLRPEPLRSALIRNDPGTDLPREILTLAETFDLRHGTGWHATLREAAADFCAAYFDEGQSLWRMPWQGESLFTAWKEWSSIDRKLEIAGLQRFRTRVRVLPDDPVATIAVCLHALRVEPEAAADYLHRLLLSIRGWAGHGQYLAREASMRGREDTRLLELLAIRVGQEAALLELAAAPDLVEFRRLQRVRPDGLSRATAISHLGQLALEHAWERRIRRAIASGGSVKPSPGASRPEVAAVFCIDVRSEIFRRALEATSPGIETRGFAGFFGLPIEYRPLNRDQGAARCPVLLRPQAVVHECHRDPAEHAALRRRAGLAEALAHGWKMFKQSAVSCFSFVETAGLLFGAALLRDGLLRAGHPGKGTLRDRGASLDWGGGIPRETRPATAFGLLKNMGMTDRFGRLVLLCGHGSETRNNPYAAGLDCGACGGHPGDVNARVGAGLLNDPEVRAALGREHGIAIPEDTWFLAGLHNTTTDDVTLFDLADLPASHAAEVAALRRHLARAGATARRERSELLGLSAADPALDSRIRSRAADWSQVRPEWGLAGNAAFIAAPRARTAGANLGGRVFLHDYEAQRDPDNSILELIMTAPMVVANWINLQYYGSTVNNAVFGSGNKVLHNVVGHLGVCLGNGGDLETGLPLQSVHDGTRFIHEPLRLHVFLEAPTGRIDAVLAKHAAVRELVENGWLLLFATDAAGRACRYLGRGVWEEWREPGSAESAAGRDE
jgi:uncharacterized protein YbcC (UPF0753/DUF2309 family)